jgi:hydroxymethylpyrimidine/phosphomethylpyrimidine kinase
MKPVVLTVAGFDPSAGAGVTADIKTFERSGVYGVAVCTANTIQSHCRFVAANWIPPECILQQLDVLLDAYSITAAKIGIIQDTAVLQTVLQRLRSAQISRIVWDPVVRPSAGDPLHADSFAAALTPTLLDTLTLITPNHTEAQFFAQGAPLDSQLAAWARHCAVLHKSAMVDETTATDLLYQPGQPPYALHSTQQIPHPKHGSGCVLSAAITAALAHGQSVRSACESGKRYVEKYLASSETLLGYHQ